MWINSYIGQKSPLFEEGAKNGYFIKNEDGSVWQWDRWQAGMAIVDFTNPEATKWYQGYLKKLVAMGVDSSRPISVSASRPKASSIMTVPIRS